VSLDATDPGWDLPRPFLHSVAARPDDIDDFGHVNNAVYLRWADETGWAHWGADGYTRQQCRDLDRGMAIMRTEADYLGHVRAGEKVICAVWIAASDGKLRAERWYQFRKAETGETVFRAVTKLVSFQLSTGRPARMADAFAVHYAKPAPDLADAAALLMTNSKR
jgi:acyl-CoA thioester hydrolase